MASPLKTGDLVTFRYITKFNNFYPSWYRGGHHPEMLLLNGATGEVTRALSDRVTVLFKVKDYIGNPVNIKFRCYPQELELVFSA